MHRISWSRNKVERKRERDRVKENKDKQIRKEEMICVTNLQLSFAHPRESRSIALLDQL